MISIRDIPKEITTHFWKNCSVISERRRQKGLQYGFERYIHNIICWRSINVCCCSDGTHFEFHSGRSNLIQYSQESLLQIGITQQQLPDMDTFPHSHRIPAEIARPLGPPWMIIPSGRRQSRRRERKQKRGCTLWFQVTFFSGSPI